MRQCPAGVRAGQRRNRAGRSGGTHASTTPSGPSGPRPARRPPIRAAGSDDAMDALRMSSITYRIATGKHAGRKVATLQTLPADADALQGDAGQVGGFSLHAGVAAQAHERDKLERLCRYIARPAIAERRLSISPQGRVRYELKTPWKNGTTHVEFEPIDFIAKLAALVPLNDLGPMPQARVRHRRGDLRPVAVQCGSWPASKSPRRSAPS